MRSDYSLVMAAVRSKIPQAAAPSLARERRLPETKDWDSDAVRLYEQGVSTRQVAQRFGCGYGIVRRVLMRRTTLRTRGEDPRV